MSMKQEVLLIVIGAIIGFASSIGTTIVAAYLRKFGKLKLYSKIVYSKLRQGQSWGFYKNGAGDIVFEVPLWIEIQNTSNETRVIRDVNIVLFCKGKRVTEMTQMNRLGEDTYFGNDGAYSFVSEPRSIKKYDCEFEISLSRLKESCGFDEIRLRYFDESEREKLFPLHEVSNCWEIGSLKKDDNWQLLKR